MSNSIRQEVNINASPKRVYDTLLVQAWRVAVWSDGLYSIVKFELQPQGSQTRLVLDHVGFPEEMRAHLNGEEAEGGWHRRYWEPLKKYLA
jgi:hypothetical protein